MTATTRPNRAASFEARSLCSLAPQDDGHSSLMRHAQDGLDRGAAVRILRRAVDVGERIKADHSLNRHLTLHQEIDQLRNEFLRMALALDDAADGAPELQKRHLQRDFRSG